MLGEPGSRNRNPFIAEIFHETNIAETKGSGIRTMRNLMKMVQMVPPTFESDHSTNQFTIRLLLHHLLNEEDIIWLNSLTTYSLSDFQKIGLVFVREAGAIDNSTYRQLNGCGVLKASIDLRALRDNDILIQKGKARATYYIPSPSITKSSVALDIRSGIPVSIPASIPGSIPVSIPVSAPVSAPVNKPISQLPLSSELQGKLNAISPKEHDSDKIKLFILLLCRKQSYHLQEIAEILSRQPKYILKKFIQPLIQDRSLEYTEPDMPNHPNQAYRTKK